MLEPLYVVSSRNDFQRAGAGAGELAENRAIVGFHAGSVRGVAAAFEWAGFPVLEQVGAEQVHAVAA